ncbi:hypothetical protein ETSB_1308 [cyanobacterium endosymbiont of Epithemia turgida isolate EtSB Lake Yunoko]|nr:hypothetical protein ETSB_1308 [cyanobacterium endosymbiont of Epithemia turgida isolate EtSB Lake Yunoko]
MSGNSSTQQAISLTFYPLVLRHEILVFILVLEKVSRWQSILMVSVFLILLDKLLEKLVFSDRSFSTALLFVYAYLLNDYR